MGRGIGFALAVSLALNVFAAGFFAGRVIGGDREDPAEIANIRGEPDPFALMRHAHNLPNDAREPFRTAFQEQLPELRSRNRQMRQHRRQLAELIAADEIDRAAVRTMMQKMHELQSAQHAAFSKAFVEAIASLPPEERRALLMKSAHHGPHHRRWRATPGDPWN